MDAGISRHRPMEVSEIIRAAFRLYWRNAWLFISVLAVALVPQAILNAVSPALAAISPITNACALGALTVAVSARYSGHDITIRGAYSALVITTFLTLFVSYVAYVVIVSLGLALLVVPGIYLMVRFAFFVPAVVLERRNLTGAFSRSSDLVRGHWWHVCAVGVLAAVTVAISQGAAGLALRYLLPDRLSFALGTLAGLLVLPIGVGSLVLLYYDLRLRTEGPIRTPSMAGVP